MPTNRSRSRLLPLVAFSALLTATCLLFFAGGFLLGQSGGSLGRESLAAIGIVAGSTPATRTGADDQRRIGVLGEALDEIDRNYLRRDQVDHEKLVQGALKGMVDALGDPYTVYLTPEQRVAGEAELEGRFDGIGIEVDLRDGALYVIAPLDGSPAQQAGLTSGDRIVQVDGHPIEGLSLSEVVSRIRGPRGSSVALTILRGPDSTPFTVAVTRNQVTRQLVRTREIDDGVRIGYLRVSSFAQPTASQLDQYLKTLLEDKPQGLVLDLRGNPGGYLQSAVEVTSQFLRDGVVLYQQGANADAERKTYRATGSPQAPDLPMAVLVDHGSASASEIVAAALRDNNRAILVGQKTFGKGTVQEIHRLSDDSQLRITVAQWLTPSGRPIQGEGLVPDVEVQAHDGEDAALAAAVQYLRARNTTARG